MSHKQCSYPYLCVFACVVCIVPSLIQAVTVHDTRSTCEADLGTNFFLRHEDTEHGGTNRYVPYESYILNCVKAVCMCLCSVSTFKSCESTGIVCYCEQVRKESFCENLLWEQSCLPTRVLQHCLCIQVGLLEQHLTSNIQSKK